MAPPSLAAMAIGDRGGDCESRSVALAVTVKMPVAVGHGGRRLQTSMALEAQVLRHSPQRFLVGEDTAIDGAGTSCHSNNVHNTCSGSDDVGGMGFRSLTSRHLRLWAEGEGRRGQGARWRLGGG